MSEAPGWIGRITVRRADRSAADRLEQALAPEAAREVPRAHARIVRADERTVRVEVEARDTGSVRAAVNTYLGWISLTERTESAVPLRPASREP